ncbi:MAG: ATP-binding protein [Flavobacteriia bacterium]|nr:ATP-binding protein [Flavobacteriia bacterium]
MENIRYINNLFNYLEQFIEYRVSQDIHNQNPDYPLFNTDNYPTVLNSFFQSNELNESDLLGLGLGLYPHLLPTLFTDIISQIVDNEKDYTEMGGFFSKNHKGFLPTGETLIYLLAGKDIEKRAAYYDYIFNESPVFTKQILKIEYPSENDPRSSGRLTLDQEFMESLVLGKYIPPDLSSDFPARLITTPLDWSNLILQPKTKDSIEEIKAWLKHERLLMDEWGLKNKVKPGLRVLFYGNPGTGKTLTATLLGKHTDRNVYRIDLSLVVSKYIGETEKNLSKLFDKAANKNWILFFDEADSIFGKRTNVQNAHDKYANQEVSYLLQRIEAHPGIVILATNQKGNIDPAFVRRFQFIIEFEMPGEEERLLLWQDNFPEGINLDAQVSLRKIAKQYELTGANIVNIVQYCCLKAACDESNIVTNGYIMSAIKREYQKEGKLM